MTFDLMKEFPQLDVPTLNFIWDYLWRKNAVSRNRNADERSRSAERSNIMQMLQEYADLKCE